MSTEQDQQDDNGSGLIAALRRFYRDHPVSFALALIVVSTLCLITGIWMLPTTAG